MFSFVGDTVLDPFLGTGTTSVAAARHGRNSIGYEIDNHYFSQAVRRMADATASFFNKAKVQTHGGGEGVQVKKASRRSFGSKTPVARG